MNNRKLDDCQLKQLDKMFNLYEMEGISGTVVQECNGYDDYSDCHLPPYLKERNADYDKFMFLSDYDDYSDSHMVGDKDDIKAGNSNNNE